ncbi:MAG: rhodanese-like domain-containing protein [Candidatus Nanopelagicales bacterium]
MSSPQPYVEVDLDTFARAHLGAPYVLDVREPEEYRAARVPGAVLMPLRTVPEHLDQIPRTDPVYVVCAVGSRSARATQWLRAQGVDAVNVAGGTQAWVESGRAYEQG